MLVCHCKAVNDATIAAAVRHGGASASVASVGSMCGAGTDCGGCHNAIASLIEHHESRALVSVRS